ncbi:MAG: alpha/beta hydrolase [Elainellaceae cyanobacterium]
MNGLPLKRLSRKQRGFGWRLALGFFIGLVPLLKSQPVTGAEKLTLSYGVLQQSIRLDELETYASTGSTPPDLAAYVHHVSPEQLTELRQILLTRFPVEERQVSQFLQTSLGKQIVHRLSNLIQSESASQPSIDAIQVALMQAASDPEGLSLLNVLRQFPGEHIKVDVARALELRNTLTTFIQQTNQVAAQIDQQAQLEIADSKLDQPDSFASFAKFSAPEQHGAYTWIRHTIELNDQRRDRAFPVDIYLPLVQSPRPLIVISHGLSAERANFTYLAQHLASYGYVVAVPEHVGSNWQYMLTLFDGKTDRLMQPQEFIDRPLDITYLLDELGQFNQADPILKGRLNLQQVGIVGQSLGGYTALALAGAPLNFEQLAADCQDKQHTLNISLLLQCQALELPHRNQDLTDPRIKAIVVISPIGSSILGQASFSKIDIPVLMVAGTADTMAPALLEQMQPFTWLTTPDKYLALIKGGTHFSSLAPRAGEVFTLHQGTALESSIAQRYIMALSNSFFQTHIDGQEDYQPYLTATYAHQISHIALPLSLVRSITIHQPQQAASGFSWNSPLLLVGVIIHTAGILGFVAVRKWLRSAGYDAKP